MLTAQEQFRTLAGVIANPKPDHPQALREGVWLAIKEMKGQPLSIDRMARVGADPVEADVANLETARRMKRIRDRVRAHAKKHGVAGPRPLILPQPASTAHTPHGASLNDGSN